MSQIQQQIKGYHSACVEWEGIGNEINLRSSQPFGHVPLTENMNVILSERAARSNVECLTVRGMFSLYLAVHCASRVRCDRSLESDFWSIVGARWSRKGAANAFVTPLPVAASPGTYLRATTCCGGRRVKGEVRLRRNHRQETSRPAGSGGSPQNDERCPSGAGCRAGTPASYQLSRPSRPDPERALPLLKADDQRLAQSAGTRTAQVVIGHHHHHHHHGARAYVRVGLRAHRHHHHHHHHHHRGY